MRRDEWDEGQHLLTDEKGARKGGKDGGWNVCIYKREKDSGVLDRKIGAWSEP